MKRSLRFTSAKLQVTRFVDLVELQPESTALPSQSRCRRNKANVCDNKLGTSLSEGDLLLALRGRTAQTMKAVITHRTNGPKGTSPEKKGDANLVNNLLSPFPLCGKKEKRPYWKRDYDVQKS